ncbi:MAG TPA: Ig-like domain-containing protein [Bacteroidales bacterium]|nr:Ig-like domain-containing protein [Bacteroidales bacterium]
MLRKIPGLLSFLLPAVLILSRCANPVTPQGGPKDVSPPKVVKATPPNHSIHFNSHDIELRFGEFIQLKEPQNKITVSPPYLSDIDYRLQGKTLLIKLRDSLRQNMTYSIYFGDAISDITESNILKNFSYVFSTGSYIDSLSLEGDLVDAFTLQTEPDVWATLYANENDTLPLDSLPMHVPPLYRTRSDDHGHFVLHNLKEGKFLLFAVKDLNGNTYFDQPTEAIAFCDSLVNPVYIPPSAEDTLKHDTVARKDSLIRQDSLPALIPSFPVYKLRMFLQEDSIQRILRKTLVSDRQVMLVFKYPLVNPQFEALHFIPGESWMKPEFSKRMDTATLWLTSYPYDSLILKISDKGKAFDTASFDLTLKREKKKVSRSGTENQPHLVVTINPPDGRLNPFRSNPVLVSSMPLEKYDLTCAKLVADKDTVPVPLVLADSIKRKMMVPYKWKEGKSYVLIVPDSAFTAINGRSNDSLRFSFKTYEARDFGTILIRLKGTLRKGDLLLQLLGNNDAVVIQKTVTAPGDVLFDYLLPATYRLRLIFDENSNGRWDSGNFPRKLQPEEVQYFPKSIEVRGNWDIDETWEF